MEVEGPMTEYERRRLENVLHNKAKLVSLGVQQSVAHLATPTRSKVEQKGYKRTSVEKRQRDEPIVIRRSLRSQGLSPDGETKRGLERELGEDFESELKASLKIRKRAPRNGAIKGFSGSDMQSNNPSKKGKEALSLASVYLEREGVSHSAFIERLQCISDGIPLSELQGGKPNSHYDEMERVFSFCDPSRSLVLSSGDIARVVPERIFNVRFLPLKERVIAVAGDKAGHLGLWDVDCDKSEGDGVYIYRPHSAPISGIDVSPYSVHKVVTCSYDGAARFMDIDSKNFQHFYLTDELLTAVRFVPDNRDCLYLAEAEGVVKLLDLREKKVSNVFELHSKRVNSIDFNPKKSNLMATSSTDGTACIWDVRSLSRKARSLETVHHSRAVHSAYFSPSGSYLATCSYDDNIGLIGPLHEEEKGADVARGVRMIYHNNATNRWISSFRAIWGWDDQHILVGNMGRGIDIISTQSGMLSSCLKSPSMTTIPCRLASHPVQQGVIAGGSGGGQVYIWREQSE